MKTNRMTIILILAVAIAYLSLLTGCVFTSTDASKSSENKTDSPGGRDSKASGKKTEPTGQPPVEQRKGEKPLDNSVEIISVKRCWSYRPKEISVEGRLFESFAVLDHRCSSEEYVTFDIRGWSRFTGYAAIVRKDARSNTLAIKVDEETVAEHQLNYGASAIRLDIDLRGRKTLTFKKAGRYPEIILGEPKLAGDN